MKSALDDLLFYSSKALRYGIAGSVTGFVGSFITPTTIRVGKITSTYDFDRVTSQKGNLGNRIENLIGELSYYGAGITSMAYTIYEMVNNVPNDSSFRHIASFFVFTNLISLSKEIVSLNENVLERLNIEDEKVGIKRDS